MSPMCHIASTFSCLKTFSAASVFWKLLGFSVQCVSLKRPMRMGGRSAAHDEAKNASSNMTSKIKLFIELAPIMIKN